MGKKEEYEQGVKDGQRGGFFDDLAHGIGNTNSPYGEGYSYGVNHRYNDQGQRYHSYDNTGVTDPRRNQDNSKASNQYKSNKDAKQGIQTESQNNYSGSDNSSFIDEDDDDDDEDYEDEEEEYDEEDEDDDDDEEEEYDEDDEDDDEEELVENKGGAYVRIETNLPTKSAFGSSKWPYIAGTLSAIAVASLIWYESLPSTRARRIDNEAMDHFHKKEYVEAVKDFDKAEKLESWRTNGYYEQESLQLLLDETADKIKKAEFKGTLKSLEFYLEHKPNNLKAVEYKVEALTKKGKNLEALTELRKILAEDPNNIRALQLRGLNLTEEHLYDRAIEAYDRILQLKPDDQWTIQARKKTIDKSDDIIWKYVISDILFWGSTATFVGYFAWMFGTVFYEQWKDKKRIKS